MGEPLLEAVALIAESIRRSTRVVVDDLHIGVGLAMCNQIRQIRTRRTAKSIKSLNKHFRTRHDRSLAAAAFPAIYASRFTRQNVCVIVSNETYMGEDAELYRTILEEPGGPAEVKVMTGNRWPEAEADDGRPTIMVATPEILGGVEGYHAAIIARLSPEATKRISRRLPGTAALPDP